jgi:hypothetical protein
MDNILCPFPEDTGIDSDLGIGLGYDQITSHKAKKRENIYCSSWEIIDPRTLIASNKLMTPKWLFKGKKDGG